MQFNSEQHFLTITETIESHESREGRDYQYGK